MDEVLLGETESSSVGDVVGAVVGLGVLTVDTSDLHVVFLSNSLESCLVLRKLGESDVDGSTECGTEVGGARGNVTKVVVVGKLGDLFDSAGSAA